MKKRGGKMRLAINLVATLIIGAVAFLAYRSSSQQSVSAKELGLPPLRSEVTSVKIDERDQRGEINVSLIVDLDAGDPDNIVSDMVAIFIWGRAKLKPLVCGPDYPPNLCVQRWVKITWVTPKDTAGDSYPITTIGLDQLAIDRLSERDIHGYEEFNKFIKHIAEESNGTALFYQEYPAVPEPFTGFK